ncbi:hypothetical protein GGX14DRAFT_577481 [Mycena pura]|uniref:DUF6534 domain-containing protein n=1 Tax=Mycena pura TaxID=153505 RepID=A0AAD6UVQ8_9AGAR|nr:hypothetical protein GGX14DRAFT_577481 [Mycena pura]
MASPIANTFSVWLIVLFLQSILYGIGLLQVWLYFLWYPRDSWGTKGTVALITVLETFQSVVYFMACYQIFITNFDNLPALAVISWLPCAQLGALYASTFVVQGFFGYCIYNLHQKRPILPAAIALFALAAFGSGLAQVVLAARIKFWADLGSTSVRYFTYCPSTFMNGVTQAATNTQAAFALAADILIIVGLCWPLNRSRTEIQATNRMINFLIIMAVNRGVLTMITALINIVLFLAKPGTFYFMLMVESSGKLYMNNMMAT